MATDKVETLLGFAIKSGNVVFGSDSIEHCRKRMYLIILCGTLAVNSREKLLRAYGGVPKVISGVLKLEDITHRIGVKALAVTDRQMAQAILNNMNGSYRLVTEVK